MTRIPKKSTKRKVAGKKRITRKDVDALSKKVTKATKHDPQLIPLRQRAAIEYATDPKNRTIRSTYERGEWCERVPWNTFAAWAREDGWKRLRSRYHDMIMGRAFRYAADSAAKFQLRMLRTLQEQVMYVSELLDPIRDENGEIKRDPDTGKPQFAVKLGDIRDVANAQIGLLQRLDAIAASSALNPPSSDENYEEGGSDAMSSKINLSEERVASLARLAVLDGKEFSQDDVIDILGEESSDDGESDKES